MDREYIIFASQVIMSKYIDKVITYFWIETGEDDNILIIRYLPLPSYDSTSLHKMKKQIALILNTAADNDIFDTCQLCNLHMVSDSRQAIF